MSTPPAAKAAAPTPAAAPKRPSGPPGGPGGPGGPNRRPSQGPEIDLEKWKPIAAGVLVGLGLITILYKLFSGGKCRRRPDEAFVCYRRMSDEDRNKKIAVGVLVGAGLLALIYRYYTRPKKTKCPQPTPPPCFKPTAKKPPIEPCNR